MSKRLAKRGDPELEAELERKAEHVSENGPRLTYHSTIHLVAKCQTGKHELHGGLGAMGVGEMWWLADPRNQEDAEAWAALPVQTCSNFGIIDACPRDPLTPKELADVVCYRIDNIERSGGNVPRWLMIIETPSGLEVMGRGQDVPDAERREWLAAASARFPRLPSQNTADTERIPPVPDR